MHQFVQEATKQGVSEVCWKIDRIRRNQLLAGMNGQVACGGIAFAH
jgi:hypothetical protein